MPAYRFYDLRANRSDGEKLVLFNDDVAMIRALSDRYPDGCEVWHEQRLVGRFHRPTENLDLPSQAA